MPALTGSSQRDVLQGGPEDDTLRGMGGSDRLAGGRGDDVLDGGKGNDRMVGGQGNDTYLVDAVGDRVVEFPTPYDRDNLDDYYRQQDTVIASVDYSLRSVAFVEDLRLVGRARHGIGNDLDNVITGNGSSNLLEGLGGNDTLNGGARTDVLRGGSGVDTLDGGTGADVMAGGSGSDVYWVDSRADQVLERPGDAGGSDAVYTSVSLGRLYDHVEGVVLTGDATRVTGNALDNWIFGDALDDTIAGGAGDDYLVGAAGRDRLSGGRGDDVLVGGSEQYQFDEARDVLRGGAGSDTFRLVELYPGMAADQVLDFDAARDTIELPTWNSYGYIDPSLIAEEGRALLPGALHVGAGQTGQGTAGAGLYVDSATGDLWYDPTSGVAGDSILFLHVTAASAATMTAQDFLFA